MQRPITGTPASTRSRSSSSSPSSRTRSIAFGIAPTPGSTIAVGLAHARVVARELRLARPRARAPCRPSAGCPCRSRGSRSRVTGAPLVEGTPSTRGRPRRRPARSARANALNDASTMWCAFVPASTRTCSVSLAALATARKNSSARSVSKSPTRSAREVALERRERPAGDVDRGGRARLVHRHDRVAEAARCPARSPSASSSAWPSAMPVSSTVWCGPGLEVALARARRGRGRRGARRASSRWSKKPTPVSRSPAPVPSRSSDSETSVSPVVRWICAVRLTRGAPWTRRARESPRRARGRRRAGARRAARLAGQGYASHAAPERGRREGATGSARRRRWAARGSSRRRSRRRPCRRRAPTNTQPALRTRSASASASSPTSSRCSGAICSASCSAAPRVRRVDQPAARRPRRSAGPAPAARRASATASSSAASGEMQPDRAVLAVLGLGQQVERDQLRVGAAAAAITTSSLGPAMPVDADLRRPPGASPPARTGCRARRSRRRPAPTRCRRRARRSPARRPSGRPRSPRRATQAARITGCARPPRPGGAQTAISLDARGPRRDRAHHDRRRVRRAAARHVDRRAAAPGPRRPRPRWPSGSSTRSPARAAAPRRPRARSRSRVRRPSQHGRLEHARRDASSSCAIHAQLLGPELGVVEALGVARAPRRRRWRRTCVEDLRARRLASGARVLRPDPRGSRADPHRARTRSTIASISLRLQLVRHRVGDQPGGADRDLLHHAQAVLGQRACRWPSGPRCRRPGRSAAPARPSPSPRRSRPGGRSRRSAAAATRGYLVAIRTRPRRRRASPIGSPPSGAATTMRQRPKPRSSSS